MSSRNVMVDIPTVPPITVDLPPGYTVLRNPQMHGVLYVDERGRLVSPAPFDCDAHRQNIHLRYRRRQDKPKPLTEKVNETPKPKRTRRKRA